MSSPESITAGVTGDAAQQSDEIGTTPAGAIVSEELIAVRAKTRWHKLTAFLVTVAALVAVAVVAVKIDKDAASVVYASMAGATVTALIAYITGNVKEHTVVAGLGGMATALLAKLPVPKKP